MTLHEIMDSAPAGPGEGMEPIPIEMAEYLVAMAGRAPSLHNTQPWQFGIDQYTIELYADPGRKLHTDPVGRQMVISCGAALFGLRLAVRSLGYQPVVTLLPQSRSLRLLARVRLGAADPMTSAERALLEAVPHRHTHRGSFTPDPFPDGLLARLQHDAVAEGATLAIIDSERALSRLLATVGATHRRQDLSPVSRADMRRWTRSGDNPARDGVPARAFPASPLRGPGRLPQRDFDLGRGIGLLAGEDSPAAARGTPIDGLSPVETTAPAATAALFTVGDGRTDWLRTGQALYRLLLDAASQWVFASLYSQPLEAAGLRQQIKASLNLLGAPQMLLQFGVSRSTLATSRRPVAEIIRSRKK